MYMKVHRRNWIQKRVRDIKELACLREKKVKTFRVDKWVYRKEKRFSYGFYYLEKLMIGYLHM